MIDNISWITVYPEIVLLVMACVIALVDLGVKSPAPYRHLCADHAHAGRGGRSAGCVRQQRQHQYGFGNMVVSDPWATGSSALPRWP
jgi:NADH-quinone oxidoreductase subunit N